MPDTWPAAPIGTAGESRAPLSAWKNRSIGFAMASVVLHAAVIAVLVMVVTPPLAPPPPDDVAIDLVFEQSAPVPAAQPEPPPAAPPEPAPTFPEPAPPMPDLPLPEPVPLPPITEPPPPPVQRPLLPRPKLPPLRRPPPSPVEREPVETPAPPRAEPATQAPAVAPVAPVMDRSWVAAVSAWLASRKTYPEQARQRGEEGNVSVRFTVDRSGRVVEAAIVKASGSALLDEAALGLLRQAVFPAFPADMTQAQITITTTVRYSLR